MKWIARNKNCICDANVLEAIEIMEELGARE
jgi:hypothetical protein